MKKTLNSSATDPALIALRLTLSLLILTATATALVVDTGNLQTDLYPPTVSSGVEG